MYKLLTLFTFICIIDVLDRFFERGAKMNLEELTVKNMQFTVDNGKTFYKVRKILFEEKKFYDFLKRFFDICASLLAIIVLAIPMLIVAVCVKMDSCGPILYRQERVGRNGETFMLYKFRSMQADAEKDGAKWAEYDDDRCTRIGKILRKTHIDELPQLFNILSGDMSVVGPRPERDCFYAEFESYIEGFSQRLCVKPGLSGLAQISGGYDLTPEQKILFDLEYIEKRSFWFDIKIIFMTFIVVFSLKGAR